MKIKYLIILIIAINYCNLLSQTDTLFKNEQIGINIKGGLLFNNYNLNFSSFYGAVDCGIFSSGSGISYLGEVSVEKSFNESLQLSLLVGYYNRSGLFAVNNTFESRDLNTNQVVLVTTENSISANLSFLEFSPELKYTIIRKLITGPLILSIGPRFAIPIIKKFEQREKILSPDNAVFINSGGYKTQTRELANGDISSINSLQYGFRINLENLLNIGNGNFFTQSIGFDYNLSDVTSDAKWKIWSLNLAVGIRYSIKDLTNNEKIQNYELSIDDSLNNEKTILDNKPEPKLQININSIDNLEVEKGTELLATIPLVNAIFFDQNNSDIPSFYSTTRVDSLDLFYSDPIRMHSFILQRLADIILKNKNASITLQSSTSGQDEGNSISLSQLRAENVKNALIKFGVPANKININTLINPINPSNQDVIEGKIENRRVVIIVQNAPLQEYVDIINYRELSGKVNYSVKLENFIDTSLIVQESINNTKVAINKKGNYHFNFKRRLENNDNNIHLNINTKIDKLNASDSQLIDISKAKIVEKEINLDNFLAILLFEFNKSELNEANKLLLKQLSDKLPNNSTIELIGSADIIGSNEYNQELAKQRAYNTEKYIKLISKNKFNIITKTMVEKFDDTTPQGRYLNRSIKIRLIK